jgi:hypothetical protein
MFDSISWPVLGLVLLAFALLAVAVLFERRRERHRLEQLTGWVATRAYTIEAAIRPVAEAGLAADLVSLPLFRRGRGQKVRNVIRGRTPDGTALLFDFRFTTQSGKQTATTEQTVAAFELPGPGLPWFRLSPEVFFQKIGQALGDPDIDFDSNPEFSRKYQLRGSDPDAVRRLFEREAVTCLAGLDGWSAEGGGAWLIVFRHDHRPKPDDLTAFVDDARAIARAITGR